MWAEGFIWSGAVTTLWRHHHTWTLPPEATSTEGHLPTFSLRPFQHPRGRLGLGRAGGWGSSPRPRVHRATWLRAGQHGHDLQAHASLAHTPQLCHHFHVLPPLARPPIHRHDVVPFLQASRLWRIWTSEVVAAHLDSLGSQHLGLEDLYLSLTPRNNSSDEDRRVSPQSETKATLSSNHVHWAY